MTNAPTGRSRPYLSPKSPRDGRSIGDGTIMWDCAARAAERGRPLLAVDGPVDWHTRPAWALLLARCSRARSEAPASSAQSSVEPVVVRTPVVYF